MKPFRSLALGLASVAVVLGGCASVPRSRDSNVGRVCVNVREIHSIGALEDDQNAFAIVGTNRYYLFSVDKGCMDLRFARGIAIGDGEARVCGDGFSFLSFQHPDLGPMRCRIEEIVAVENKAAARELIEARKSDEPE
jgi:hypothetical protein